MADSSDLLRQMSAFASGAIPLQEFHNWFEDNSAALYSNPESRLLYAEAESAISELLYDQTGEDALRRQFSEVVCAHTRETSVVR